MIDTRKLKELVRLMVENDLSELDLRDQEETVTIKRGGDQPPVVHHAAPVIAAPPAGAAAAATDGLTKIESPMVGTYYSKPNPDSDNFTSVGASIGSDSVVCIIEAMKVFNEIKAECSGTIEKICVNDGDAVEFGQTLFLVRPN
ncbi:MAG: acetyl-CoA carboxylase biotin carboxyl carrier protein [Phycisphaerales bacterium]|jgi:acetyl-CoA carboxylase biotin carboxyl carrier protein